MRSVFNHLLAGLCTADLAFCLSCLAVTPVALGRPDLMVPWVHALAEAASHLALTASVLLTTALAHITTPIYILVSLFDPTIGQ